MTDLRTRIAKVLHQRGTARDDVEDGWTWTWEQESEYEQRSWLEDADAVIRELGDLKTLIAEAIYNSEYNLRYHRIDMWGAYQYADAILKALPKDTE